MLYISKGAILKPCSINSVQVSRCGREYTLSNPQSKLWLAGRFGVASADQLPETQALHMLEELGLVELSEGDGNITWYRLLINCVICRAVPMIHYSMLNRNERRILKWITCAGGKLTISELVYLMEKGITPNPSFLGKDNWHTLVNTIYTTETIFDGILDAKMENSPARQTTVTAILGLLRKKRILLV